MTAHIESSKDDIAKVVLMPGDPLRAKYIAEHFLTDYKIVNKVRNMFAYSGYYKGNKVTVFSSGMGIPSIGIYAYELFKFYDVEKIIRIGTSGTIHKDVKLLDVIFSSVLKFALTSSPFISNTAVMLKYSKLLKFSCSLSLFTTRLKIGV